MIDALSDVDSSILDCKKSIEEFDNALLELHTEVFNRIQDRFSDLDSEISNIIDLFDDMEVSNDKGIWSKEGITQLGLLTQQYELAQYQVKQYNDEIDELNRQYLAGKYSATEYMDRLASLNSSMWDSVKASESALSSIMDLNEARVENAVKGIEKEIESYKELSSQQLENLRISKERHDYQKSLSDKTKSLENIDRQIIAVQNDTSASGIARLKKLQDEHEKALGELSELEYEHSIETQEEALNKQLENYEKERNDEIEALRASLNDKEAILAESFETVKNNASLVGQEIANMAVSHGITVSNALISSWQSGEKAIASYGEILSQGTSAFIGNIMAVEAETWNLQANANATADTLAWMFSVRADNLVNELATSYYAESNLANMTNALQQSLINTLERGYNVSSIVNSLSSVENAARSAKSAIDAMNNTSRNSGGGSGTSSMANEMTGIGAVTAGLAGITASASSTKYDVRAYHSGEVLTTLDHYPSQEEIAVLGARYEVQTGSKHLRITKRAKGVHDLDKDEIAWTQEAGRELIVSPSRNAILTPLSKGDTVLTKEQSDNMYEWSNINPDKLMTLKPLSEQAMYDMWVRARVKEPEVDRSVNAPVCNYYDSMIHVDGDVIDGERIMKQIEKGTRKIMNQEITKSWREFGAGLRR